MNLRDTGWEGVNRKKSRRIKSGERGGQGDWRHFYGDDGESL